MSSRIWFGGKSQRAVNFAKKQSSLALHHHVPIYFCTFPNRREALEAPIRTGRGTWVTPSCELDDANRVRADQRGGRS